MQWNEKYNEHGFNGDAQWDDHVVIWKDGRAILAKAGMHSLYDKYKPDINHNDKMNIVKGFKYSFRLPKAPISMLAETMNDDKFWIDVKKAVDNGEVMHDKQVLVFGKLTSDSRPDYHLGHWKREWNRNYVLVDGKDFEDPEFYRFIEEPKVRQTQLLAGSVTTVICGSRASTITEWGIFNPLPTSRIPLPVDRYNVWRTGAFTPKVERIDKI